MIAAAESVTGGLAADFIVRVPGASRVFWGSFVTYTADAKVRMLGVPEGLIKKHGEVSKPVALAMAEGALKKSGSSIAFSVTGLAGPGGDSSAASANTSAKIPIGTVWIGIAGMGRKTQGSLWSEAKMFCFKGGRNEVRGAAAVAALKEVLIKLGNDIDRGEILA